MNDKNYSYFLTIAELRNLSKAAEKLYVSQPSLSQYLNRLENELGIKLFDRSKSPLRLTYAGEKYLEHIKKTLEMNRQILAELDDIKMNYRGKLKIGINTQRGAYMLPDIIPIFRSQFPNIELELREGSSDYLESLILKDEIDFCFLNLTNYSDHFSYEHLMHEKIFLAAYKNHPIVKDISTSIENPTNVDLSIFKDQPFISLMKTQNLSTLVNNLFGKYGLKQNIAIETSNLTTAMNLVSANAGYFTFVPEVYAKHSLNVDRLSFFTVDTPELFWPLNIVYKKDAYLSKAALNFLAITKEIFHD